MSVSEAVERDLAQWPDDVAKSALAAAARSLATELDDPENSATSKSMCAKALADLMGQLRAFAPEKKEGDQLDDLAAKRAARRGESAA